MTIRNALAGVAVRNLDEAVVWYTRLIGRAPDDHPMSEVYQHGFPSGGWLQIFADGDRAGKSSLTLAVSSLEETLARLRTQGIAPGEPTHSDYVDTASVIDPDGNRIVFAEAKTPENRAAA